MGERGRTGPDAGEDGPGGADASERADQSGRADSSDPDRTSALAGAGGPLVVWALAAFHASLLVALGVAGLHLAGPLGDLLGGLDTLLGLALFVVLWAITWWTNRRWFDAVTDPETDASASVVVGTGGKWGGVAGVCFLWVLLGGFSLVNLGDFDLAGVLYFLVAVAIASLLAAAVGAIVGALFAALDVALFRIADRVGPVSDA